MSEMAVMQKQSMDFLNGNIKHIYKKYLAAAFGSSLISCIYSVVDMAMVGNYKGPEGTAALATAMPVWSILYSLGFLMGIGGSVIFSTIRGRTRNNEQKANEYFTAASLGVTILSAVIWLLLIFCDTELLTLFGAKGSLLPIAREYVLPIKYVAPLFLLNQMVAAFLRNDRAPGLATKAVLIGGIFNVFGDYFFIFTLDWGVYGAGFATALGAVITFLIMLSHFFSKKNTLHFVKTEKVTKKLKEICITGFPTFFIDIAIGILNVLLNRQIIYYLGTNALSVYAIVINITSFVQCCAYSVGQAAQPIISTNLGAGKGDRIKTTLKYALETTTGFALFWTILSLSVPNFYTCIFMTPTDDILKIAPHIIRCYGLSYLILPFNVFSTYYFQALMKPKIAFVVSVARGVIISGILIYLLPLLFGADSIWFAMPITEVLIVVYVIIKMLKYTKQLSNEEVRGI
jgi:putative MATE family efflux protein